MLLLVLIAFSGVASASFITDKGSKVVYVPWDLDSSQKHIYNWYLVYYDKTHSIFKFTETVQFVDTVEKYDNVNHLYVYTHPWRTFRTIKHIVDFKLTKKSGKYNIITIKTSGATAQQFYKTIKYGNTQIIKTKKTPYGAFKEGKQLAINKYIYGKKKLPF